LHGRPGRSRHLPDDGTKSRRASHAAAAAPNTQPERTKTTGRPYVCTRHAGSGCTAPTVHEREGNRPPPYVDSGHEAAPTARAAPRRGHRCPSRRSPAIRCGPRDRHAEVRRSPPTKHPCPGAGGAAPDLRRVVESSARPRSALLAPRPPVHTVSPRSIHHRGRSPTQGGRARIQSPQDRHAQSGRQSRIGAAESFNAPETRRSATAQGTHAPPEASRRRAVSARKETEKVETGAGSACKRGAGSVRKPSMVA